VCPTPSSLTPLTTPALGCSTSTSADSATTMDTLDGSRASVLFGSPSETPRLLSQSHPSCCCLQVPCMCGVLDMVTDDKVSIPCLHVPSPHRPWAPATAAPPADSDNVVPILHFTRRPAMFSCASDDEVRIAHAVLSRLTSSPFYAHYLPSGRHPCCPIPSRVWLYQLAISSSSCHFFHLLAYK
jgi:hypothetical protein